MSRTYNTDVFKCEGILFESYDALIAYAKKHPSTFITYTTVDLVEVIIDKDGDLSISYSMEEYDGDDNPFTEVHTETFEVEIRSMVIL
jgi:hypothetical protein